MQWKEQEEGQERRPRKKTKKEDRYGLFVVMTVGIPQKVREVNYHVKYSVVLKSTNFSELRLTWKQIMRSLYEVNEWFAGFASKRDAKWK